jgi:hypothetical protein
VVARRLGPFPEIVERAGAGELFSSQDELHAALRRLLAEPDRRDELARRGWQASVDVWSESAVIPRYLELAQRAAGLRARRARSPRGPW